MFVTHQSYAFTNRKTMGNKFHTKTRNYLLQSDGQNFKFNFRIRDSLLYTHAGILQFAKSLTSTARAPSCDAS